MEGSGKLILLTCALCDQLVLCTATGAKNATEYPETSNLKEDVIWPMWHMMAVALVSFS